jgi:hypothetical protein
MQVMQRADAVQRMQHAAQELKCEASELPRDFHDSNADVFGEALCADGRTLFFKAHLGTRDELDSWPEISGAKRAWGAGIGAEVFQSHIPGVLVTERLAGASMTREEGSLPSNIQKVMRALHVLHRSGDAAAIAPRTSFKHTGGARSRIEEIATSGAVSQTCAASLLAKADWLDDQLSDYEIEPQWRFGDCHFGNWILLDDKVYAVDLAESELGDPLADIARYAFCIRADSALLDKMLKWYAQAGGREPEESEFRRLRLIEAAQNLDYFGYHIVHGEGGLASPGAQKMKERLLADEEVESKYGMPLVVFEEA